MFESVRRHLAVLAFLAALAFAGLTGVLLGWWLVQPTLLLVRVCRFRHAPFAFALWGLGLVGALCGGSATRRSTWLLLACGAILTVALAIGPFAATGITQIVVDNASGRALRELRLEVGDRVLALDSLPVGESWSTDWRAPEDLPLRLSARDGLGQPLSARSVLLRDSVDALRFSVGEDGGVTLVLRSWND